jgi:hypothetical protein
MAAAVIEEPAAPEAPTRVKRVENLPVDVRGAIVTSARPAPP